MYSLTLMISSAGPEESMRWSVDSVGWHGWYPYVCTSSVFQTSVEYSTYVDFHLEPVDMTRSSNLERVQKKKKLLWVSFSLPLAIFDFSQQESCKDFSRGLAQASIRWVGHKPPLSPPAIHHKSCCSDGLVRYVIGHKTAHTRLRTWTRHNHYSNGLIKKE